MNQLVSFPPAIATQPYRVTAEDYFRMIDAAIFGDAHVELVVGELLEMAPAGLEHSRQNGGIAVDLGIAYRKLNYRICIDAIVQLADETIRAPDISIVDTAPQDRDYLLPSDILLAVEVAQSTLTEDLGRKRIDYASAGIRHYWVIDVTGKRSHCFSDPQGVDYAAIKVVPFGDPIAVPGTDTTITVA